MNEDLLKASHSAGFLCAELRAAHKHLCKDKPTATERLAERHVLDLLDQATELKNALKGLAE